MKLLFLGFAVPPNIMNWLTSVDSRPQVAANKFQWGLLRGLQAGLREPISILSSVPASDYPRNPKLIFRYSKWHEANGVSGISLPYVNLVFLKQISRLLSAFIPVLSWCLKNRRNRTSIILVYGLHSPHVIAAYVAGRICRNRVVLIVPDIPQYMDIGYRRNFLRNAAKLTEHKLMMLIMRRMAGLVVVADSIACDFAPDRPFLVVEGCVSNESSVCPTSESACESTESLPFTAVYAGGLKEEYGVRLAIEAFKLIQNPNYQLYIFGQGPLDSLCQISAEMDRRITFMGFVPNDIVMSYARRAAVLLNPRITKHQFSKYSFPSKLLEYMTTGTPVITSAVPSIPKDYYKHLFLLDNEIPERLAELIQLICTLPTDYSRRFGRDAQSFVLKEKSDLRQGQRFLSFLEQLV